MKKHRRQSSVGISGKCPRERIPIYLLPKKTRGNEFLLNIFRSDQKNSLKET
jgi:hypothetical protein